MPSPGYNPLALNMPGYSPASAYMTSTPAMESPESAGSGLYSSAMQGLTSYASNIMGHTMNQYAAQSSLLSSQVGEFDRVSLSASSTLSFPDISSEQQYLKEQLLQRRLRHSAPGRESGRGRGSGRHGRGILHRGGAAGAQPHPRNLILRPNLLPQAAVPQLGDVRVVLETLSHLANTD